MEVVRKGCEQELTEHLNSIDTTGSIKFTYEEKNNNSMPFLDTVMIRKEDGTVKLVSVPEEVAHRPISELHVSPSVTPQTGVIKMLLDRCNIVSDPEYREKEVEHITKALERCGYPSWTIKKVKEQQSQKKKKRRKNTEKSKGMVTLPYVKGVTENITTRRFTREQKRVNGDRA